MKGFEAPKEPTRDEIEKIEKERTLSDAELLKGGAEYKITEDGDKKLEATDEQVEYIKFVKYLESPKYLETISKEKDEKEQTEENKLILKKLFDEEKALNKKEIILSEESKEKLIFLRKAMDQAYVNRARLVNNIEDEKYREEIKKAIADIEREIDDIKKWKSEWCCIGDSPPSKWVYSQDFSKWNYDETKIRGEMSLAIDKLIFDLYVSAIEPKDHPVGPGKEGYQDIFYFLENQAIRFARKSSVTKEDVVKQLLIEARSLD